MAKEKIIDDTFTKKELINAAHVFSATPELMAGALYNVGGEERLTKAQAATKLESFRSKPVADIKEV